MSWPPIVTLPAFSTGLRRLALRCFLCLAVRCARGVALFTTSADGFLAGGAESAEAEFATPRPRAATSRATVAARLVVWGVVIMDGTVALRRPTYDGPQVWSGPTFSTAGPRSTSPLEPVDA